MLSLLDNLHGLTNTNNNAGVWREKNKLHADATISTRSCMHAMVHTPDQKGSNGRWLIQKLESPQGLNTKRPPVKDNPPQPLLDETISLPAPMHATNIQCGGHETVNNWNHEPSRNRSSKNNHHKSSTHQGLLNVFLRVMCS
jgi:hypothetical protein